MKYNSALKSNELLVQEAAWVDLKDILSKSNQTQKSIHCMVFV